MNTPTFEYKHIGCPIDYRGCYYDSLLELKYALTIEEENAYMREGLGVYYDPEKVETVMYLKSGVRTYTPDFLIRNWYTGKAQLIEIKPEGFDDYEYLDIRQRICNHFIEKYEYDWEFKVVYENEIILTDKQQEKFRAIIQNKRLYKKTYDLDSYDHRPYDKTGRRIVRCIPHLKEEPLTEMQYKYFIRKGVLPVSY